MPVAGITILRRHQFALTQILHVDDLQYNSLELRVPLSQRHDDDQKSGHTGAYRSSKTQSESPQFRVHQVSLTNNAVRRLPQDIRPI
jgi:hypothetical protein